MDFILIENTSPMCLSSLDEVRDLKSCGFKDSRYRTPIGTRVLRDPGENAT
jgi:hypothetical protein